MKKDIIVVGGGIVGVCSALLLQRAGHTVRLIDAKSRAGKHPMAMPVCLPRHHLWC